MKRKKINILAGLTAVLMVSSTLSCKKVDDFGTLNTDPNAATVPVTGALFTSVLSNMHALAFGPAAPANTPGLNADVAGLYCQYYSETQYTDVSIFSKESLNWDDYFAANVLHSRRPISIHRMVCCLIFRPSSRRIPMRRRRRRWWLMVRMPTRSL
ncbi:hypothetical protein ACQ86N_36520 [Puia sp. P3]|uniref:hypothetical protein n=1 Tax=Puia sp. P3 TaxID=3423952 RepID=UPI003D66D319